MYIVYLSVIQYSVLHHFQCLNKLQALQVCPNYPSKHAFKLKLYENYFQAAHLQLNILYHMT